MPLYILNGTVADLKSAAVIVKIANLDEHPAKNEYNKISFPYGTVYKHEKSFDSIDGFTADSVE